MTVEPKGSHALHALKRKRAELMGRIQDHERSARLLRVSLAHVDGTLKLFDPDAVPEAIPPKRVHRRTRYFDGPELSRLILGELRKADGIPLATDAIFDAAVLAGNVPERPHIRVTLRERILAYLNEKTTFGLVVRHGYSHDALWSIARVLDSSDAE